MIVLSKDAKNKTVEYNISQNFLVPKHEIVPKEAAESIFKQHNATPESFPYILSVDPVVKELGAKVGDLLKITRKSQTAGESIYYRVVVE